MDSQANFAQTHSFNIYLNIVLGLLGPSFRKPFRSRATKYGMIVYSVISSLGVFLFFLTIGLRQLFSRTMPVFDCCISAILLIMSGLALVKIGYYFARRDKFQRFFDIWESSFQDDPYPEERRKLTQKERRAVKIQTTVLLAVFSICGVTWCASPLIPALQDLHGGRYLNVPAWFPFDHFKNPYFQIVVMFQALSGWFIVSKGVAFDGFFFTLMSLEIVELQHLKNRMEHLFDFFEEEPQIKSVQNIVRPVADASTLRNRLHHGQTNRRYQEHLNKARLEKIKTTMKSKLRDWVKHHQQAMILGRRLQEIYSPVLLAQFFSSTVILCFICFVVIAVPLDLTQSILCTVYAFGNVAQLFVLCRYGDRLADESVAVAQACYSNGWHKFHMMEIRSSLRIILRRSQVPLKISAVGVYPLSAKTFYRVIHSAYSYTMVLNDLYKQ